MIKEILYSFNKRDYFYYFFLLIILFILITKSNIINTDNILHIVVTLFLFYLFIRKKIANDYTKMDIENQKLKVINIEKSTILQHQL